MIPSSTVHRPESLTASTLQRTITVLTTVFTPDALARRLTARLSQLSSVGAVVGANLEIAPDGRRSFLSSAVGVFVDDRTHANFRTCPLDQFDEWIVNEVLTDGGGVLTYEEIATHNAGAGLHLLILCFKADDQHASDAERMAIIQQMMTRLFPQFVGYQLQSLTGRLRHSAQVLSGIQAGCRLLRPAEMSCRPSGHELLPYPALLTTDRESVDVAAWLSSAFVWRRPRLGFTAAEQQTLRMALEGYSDREIGPRCGVSLSTVKKRWDSILARVSAAAPEIFDGSVASNIAGRRGAEKRTPLLSYVTDHLEELRPYHSPSTVQRTRRKRLRRIPARSLQSARR